jgi:hypothetical protein
MTDLTLQITSVCITVVGLSSMVVDGIIYKT